jgi:hypothetical protein
MKRAIAVVMTFVVASFLGCNSRNRQAHTDSSQTLVQLLEGEYLSADYIEELKKTRSPLKASRGGMELVQVRRDGTKFVLDPIVNFHEGDSEFVITQDGSFAASQEPNVSNVSATVLNDHTIRFGYGELKPATYTYVKDATAYASNAVLVGKYKDEHGRRYDFQEDGWAVFPDRRFQFEVGLDHVFDSYDYFLDAGKDKKKLPWATWVFRWNRDVLQIFRTKEVDGFDVIADSRPYLVLHPIR